MAVDCRNLGRRARGGLASTALTLVLIAALAAPQADCSFLFVERPPPAESRRAGAVTCSTSAVAPVLDMLIAGWQVARTGLALAATDADYRGAPFSRDTDIILGVTLAGLFATSMIAGFGWTSDCRDAMEAESYPASRPLRPGAGSSPALRSYQRKKEEQDEEAAVQARAAEQARQAAEAAGAAARAAAAPAKAPAAPQHNGN